MTAYRAVLKKVGIAWIAFGLADIALMIYCISRDRSYSSSFNVFAVIAGIALLRGNLGAAQFVSRASAFMLAAFVGVILLVFPFLQPMGFLVAQLRLDPDRSIALWLMALLVLMLLAWTFRQLRSAPVLDALKASGRATGAPRFAFGLGFALAAFLGVMLGVTLNGAPGRKAVELVRQRLGTGYDYAIQSISWSGSHNRAVVAAYNDHEIRYVPVEWSD